jgi:hypothetical protein
MKMTRIYLLASLLLAGLPRPIAAATEFFLRLTTKGEYSVQLDGQTITLSNGRYRFFDLAPGPQRLNILQNGRSVFQYRVELRTNTRTIAQYNPQYGIRIVNTFLIDPSDSSRETAWYTMQPDRSTRWDRPSSTGVESKGISQILPEDFERLQAALAKEDFDDKRVELMRIALSKRMLSADQLTELLKEFSFDKQRIEAAKFGWSHLTDPANFYQVFGAFTFSSSVNELKSFAASR